MSGHSIGAYVGANGHGKTLGALVYDVLPAAKAGLPILSTVALKLPTCRRLNSWLDLWGFHDGLVFLDDVSAQLPSRQSQSVPAQLMMKLNTLRHDNVRVIWTAPAWGRADVALREVTQEVTTCRGLLPDPWERLSGSGSPLHPSGVVQRTEANKKVRADGVWRSNRLFRFKTYDATDFDNFTLHAVKDVKPVRRSWYWRPWRPEQLLYDTMAPVNLLDHVDESGACVICGGRRTARKCTCAGKGRAHALGAEGAEQVPVPSLARPVPELIR